MIRHTLPFAFPTHHHASVEDMVQVSSASIAMNADVETFAHFSALSTIFITRPVYRRLLPFHKEVTSGKLCVEMEI